MKAGFLTIGQSPRTDVLPELLAAAGQNITPVERGALDGLDSVTVLESAPHREEPTLVSRMRDGREVRLGRKFIIDRLRHCIGLLECEGSSIIILLCTGDFDELESSVPLLHPNRIMRNLVGSIEGIGRLGVMIPLPEQAASASEAWQKVAAKVAVVSASPYSGSLSDIRMASKSLDRSAVDLVVLDCIGYDKKMRAIVRAITGKPVLLPRTLIGRVASELLGT